MSRSRLPGISDGLLKSGFRSLFLSRSFFCKNNNLTSVRCNLRIHLHPHSNLSHVDQIYNAEGNICTHSFLSDQLFTASSVFNSAWGPLDVSVIFLREDYEYDKVFLPLLCTPYNCWGSRQLLCWAGPQLIPQNTHRKFWTIKTKACGRFWGDGGPRHPLMNLSGTSQTLVFCHFLKPKQWCSFSTTVSTP